MRKMFGKDLTFENYRARWNRDQLRRIPQVGIDDDDGVSGRFG